VKVALTPRGRILLSLVKAGVSESAVAAALDISRGVIGMTRERLRPDEAPLGAAGSVEAAVVRL